MLSKVVYEGKRGGLTPQTRGGVAALASLAFATAEAQGWNDYFPPLVAERVREDFSVALLSQPKILAMRKTAEAQGWGFSAEFWEVAGSRDFLSAMNQQIEVSGIENCTPAMVRGAMQQLVAALSTQTPFSPSAYHSPGREALHEPLVKVFCGEGAIVFAGVVVAFGGVLAVLPGGQIPGAFIAGFGFGYGLGAYLNCKIYAE